MADRDEWQEKESRKSVLAARHDDDDDDDDDLNNTCWDKETHSFSKSICSKVSVLELELVYLDVVVQHVSHHDAIGTCPSVPNTWKK